MIFSTESHEFAFYTSLVSHIVKLARLDIHEITDPELVHRLCIVLRFEKGVKLILFDKVHHIKATILGLEPKKRIIIEINSIEKNKILLPSITWVLPHLKREAFEESIYTLTELGVHTIQPILTQKTGKTWNAEKEVNRANKIMIAAAEQSKQFVIPQFNPILTFDVWSSQISGNYNAKIFFDKSGLPLKNILEALWQEQQPNILAFSGPEGDLTSGEKTMLRENGFDFCALTQTILRAQQAIAIGLGTLRSLL